MSNSAQIWIFFSHLSKNKQNQIKFCYIKFTPKFDKNFFLNQTLYLKYLTEPNVLLLPELLEVLWRPMKKSTLLLNKWIFSVMAFKYAVLWNLWKKSGIRELIRNFLLFIVFRAHFRLKPFSILLWNTMYFFITFKKLIKCNLWYACKNNCHSYENM